MIYTCHIDNHPVSSNPTLRPSRSMLVGRSKLWRKLLQSTRYMHNAYIHVHVDVSCYDHMIIHVCTSLTHYVAESAACIMNHKFLVQVLWYKVIPLILWKGLGNLYILHILCTIDVHICIQIKYEKCGTISLQNLLRHQRLVEEESRHMAYEDQRMPHSQAKEDLQRYIWW